MTSRKNKSGFTEFAHLPTDFHNFEVASWIDSKTKKEHLVLVKGKISSKQKLLVRVQSECMTGDVFASKRCDCHDQLQKSLKLIEKESVGIVIYLRQEGRGIGLANKIRAYHLQDQGYDTIEANHQLGFPADSRTYTVAASILKKLSISSVRLLTNNPQKVSDLRNAGITVKRLPIIIRPNSHSRKYLKTKKSGLGHKL